MDHFPGHTGKPEQGLPAIGWGRGSALWCELVECISVLSEQGGSKAEEAKNSVTGVSKKLNLLREGYWG